LGSTVVVMLSAAKHLAIASTDRSPPEASDLYLVGNDMAARTGSGPLRLMDRTRRERNA
jgi:hypothetical protein